MTGILVFVIAFGLGCITALVIHLLAGRQRKRGAPRAPQSRGLPAKESSPSPSMPAPLTPRHRHVAK